MHDLIAEGRAIDAALTAGPWFSVVNDVAGGRAVQTVDLPVSETEAHRKAWVADLIFRDQDAELIARMRNLLPALLDALEAEQRPPLGYEVVSKRPSRRDPGTFEYSSAGSIWPDREPVDNHRGYCEDLAAADPDRHGAAGDYIVVELREVQP